MKLQSRGKESEYVPGCCVDHVWAAKKKKRDPLPVVCDGDAASSCMILPEGKTCADCVHTERCVAIFGRQPTDTTCDFHPRRYRER